jgi:hypothetical protein
MKGFTILFAATIAVVASCAMEQEKKAADSPVAPEGPAETSDVGLEPPGSLDDEWSRWLVGQWDISAESDISGFPRWVRGRGRMQAEMALGGQFLLIQKKGQVAAISQEYLQYMREKLHATEEAIQALQNMVFGDLELRTVDPKTGRVVAYLFDTWRCVAQGTGRCDANKEVVKWKWSLAGAGTSVRTTERVNDNKIVVVEKYALPGGSTMEDRIVMMRRQGVPAESGDLAFLTPR